jgi:uncharacterized protein (TIGR02246 family)
MTTTETTPTTPTTPEALMRCFADRLNAGDLDGLVTLYEPTAVFAARPGVVVHGHDAIRGALETLLAIGPTISAETVEVLTAGDVALVVNEWSMTGTTSDGEDVRDGGRSTDVVRRQPDGRWLVVVDKP